MTTPFSVFSAHAAGAAGVGEAGVVATADVVDISGAMPSMKESLPSLLSPEKDDDTAYGNVSKTRNASLNVFANWLVFKKTRLMRRFHSSFLFLSLPILPD